MESPDIDIFLQRSRTNYFTFGRLNFEYEHRFSVPCDITYYNARLGDVSLSVKMKCVDCVNQCGTRSNLNFVHFLWTIFAFYATNYAMVLLRSRAADDKLFYVRHCRAEIEGDESRACKRCLWNADHRAYYDFRCRKPEDCACTVCLKQPPVLKIPA